MVDLGVMNSPGFWREVMNIEFLDLLLSNAAAPGRLDSRIDNGVQDIDTAFDVLIDAGIINSPAYWQRQIRESGVRHLDQLLINIANRSRDVLERIIHSEARGEDLRGQILVGNVIMNRHNSPDFPNGIRNVVFASGINNAGRRVFQFSPVGNGAYARAEPSESVIEAVTKVLNGVDHSQGALFFNVRGLDSWASQARTRLFTHGNHDFFA